MKLQSTLLVSVCFQSVCPVEDSNQLWKDLKEMKNELEFLKQNCVFKAENLVSFLIRLFRIYLFCFDF